MIPDSRTRDICERLRRWCHAVDAESAQYLMDEAANEINRLRIRGYEREAVAYFSDYGETPGEATRAVTLRSLLERLSNGRETPE